MAKSFRCSIVTPTTSVLDDEVMYVSLPAWDGQQGILAGQSPLLTRLGIGPLRLEFPEGGSRWYLIENGFAQMHDDVLTLLTESATAAESISLHEAEAELAEANARVVQSTTDREQVELDQTRAIAKKHVAQLLAQQGGI